MPQIEGETLLGVAAQDNKQPQPARITVRRKTVATDKKATLDDVLDLVLPPDERAMRIERDKEDERIALELRGEKPAPINRRRVTHHTDDVVSNIDDILSCELGGETGSASIEPKLASQQDEPLDLTVKAGPSNEYFSPEAGPSKKYSSPKAGPLKHRPRCLFGKSDTYDASAPPREVDSVALENQIDQPVTRDGWENQRRRSLPMLLPIQSNSQENKEVNEKENLDSSASNTPNLARKPFEWLKYWDSQINKSNKAPDASGALSDRTNTQKK